MTTPGDRCDVCGELIVRAGDGWDHADTRAALNDPFGAHRATPTDPATAAQIDGYVASGVRR
jgi:hypothetical protein